MKIISFNVNGLRARLHQLHTLITHFQPDVIALQETKVHDHDFPTEIFLQYGYNVYCYGKKQYHGVALLTRQKLLKIQRGLSDDNQITKQRIIIGNISTKIGTVTIINGYFPQGGNVNHPTKFIHKKLFYQNLQHYIKKNYHSNSLLFVMGDMNISPGNLDIGFDKKDQNIWLQQGKCSFLPEEQKWINQLIRWGLIDVFRYIHPRNNHRCYTWFDYRSNNFKINKGLRIDLLLATHPLTIHCQNINIQYEIRAMQKPSDHVPILAEFKI
ncbi:exodeoxyribonuclease III [Blochmannia endosymbiont of Polyrhachis (Hedomyrma) turneri]|uniref:exodeoxyribonuclease III n=1 Tax=Blochmannia endosymbiont of Polyrhachis (Hedomyrma) turneri TaxID=1505596 RepID=UPI00061A73B5|nr:exodeoxyribonuclease III [Blochmannia endosymbiont of Polyrhachis (Hedomyrma) turneri]AKC59999.1 exodeoxyribonuclease III [Blochmannia endosymbiont of Polyrhachis (Hedomyrma) turneri]